MGHVATATWRRSVTAAAATRIFVLARVGIPFLIIIIRVFFFFMVVTLAPQQSHDDEPEVGVNKEGSDGCRNESDKRTAL
jgi:hypothetical protein